MFAGSKLRQIVALVLLAAERHHGRAAHAFADLERLRQLAVDALFLLPDHLLDRGRAAAAIFLRPVQAGPAGIGLLLLPGLRDLENVGALQHGARRAHPVNLDIARQPFAADADSKYRQLLGFEAQQRVANGSVGGVRAETPAPSL